MHPLHKKAIELGHTYLACEPMLIETLISMSEENLFIKLGFIGMWDFLVKELSMSESQASYFQRVAQRARVIPELKQAVLSGEISLSKARRIVGVIDFENALRWIEAAKTLKQKDLERLVAEESPHRHVREGVVPLSLSKSKLTVVLTVSEEERLDRARDLLSQNSQKPATYGETVMAGVDFYLKKKDPLLKTTNATSSRTSKSSGAQREGRTPIPVHIKREVMLRDQCQCTHHDSNGVRCSQKRWLDLHHRTPVALHGENTIENLVTLCRAHHRFRHSLKAS